MAQAKNGKTQKTKSTSVSVSRLKGADSIAARTKTLSKEIRAFICDLADPDSFIETDTLMVSESPLGEAVGEGVVGGFITISGIQTAVFATNPAVLKGGIGVGSAEKIDRIVKNAVKTGSPLISVIDTSGARFGEGAKVLDGYAKILDVCADAYGSVPTVCVLKGNNFGMLSYLTAFSDLVVALDKSVMTTASPLILAADTKLDVTKVGTAASHAADSGLVSAVVKNTASVKKIISNYIELVSEPVADVADDMNRPCRGLKIGVKTATLVGEIFDKDSFLELRSAYAPSVVTGLARLGGITVGVVANNGAVNEGKLSSEAAIKICDLLVLCQSHGLPVVNLVDCSGTAVDLNQERTLIREVGNLIYDYSQLTVGKVALVVGKAIGAGYSALCSKSVFDYTAAWNGAQIGTVTGEAAAQLLYGAEIAEASDKEEAAARFAAEYSAENMAAEKVGALGLLDNVIKPEFSRSFLVSAVQTFLSKR